MVPIVSFIGYHDSGKTTLAAGVVRCLKERGYRVAVIKSTKERGIPFDRPGTDTHTHRQAGADAVTLVAPDQMVIFSGPLDMEIAQLAKRFFPGMDIIIAEGFKHAPGIAKIEVTTGGEPLLRDQVEGVVAVVSDAPVRGVLFGRDDTAQVADFIEQRFLRNPGKKEEKLVLLVNGRKLTLNGFVQEALAGTITGFVRTLQDSGEAREIEIRIRLDR